MPATSASSTCPATSGSCTPCWPAPAASTPRCWWWPPTTASCRRPSSTCRSWTCSASTDGVVALTRVDRAPGAGRGGGPAGARAARGDGLHDAPMLPVSAVTGRGAACLRARFGRWPADARQRRLAAPRHRSRFHHRWRGSGRHRHAACGRIAVGDRLALSPAGSRSACAGCTRKTGRRTRPRRASAWRSTWPAPDREKMRAAIGCCTPRRMRRPHNSMRASACCPGAAAPER